MREYGIISNENITDARYLGRIHLNDSLPEELDDMAIVPDLKLGENGWMIMNFRMVPRTQVDTRPMDEIMKGRSQ